VSGVGFAVIVGLLSSLSMQTVTLQIPYDKVITQPGQIVEIAASAIGGSVLREKDILVVVKQFALLKMLQWHMLVFLERDSITIVAPRHLAKKLESSLRVALLASGLTGTLIIA